MRVRVGWALGLLLVAALGLAASYRGLAAVPVIVLAVLLPFALLALGRTVRFGTFSCAVGVIVLAVIGTWLATDQAFTDALPRLLTTPRPAAASAGLLAPAALLVVLVATVCAACVLGEGTGAVAGMLAPVLGAAVLYVAAQALSAGTADPHGIAAAALVVIAAAGWSVPHRRGKLAMRPVAVAPLAIAVLVALGAGTLVGGAAYDPRAHVNPPTVRLAEPNPLTLLASFTANPDLAVLRARMRGTVRLHLATLSRFTGDSWQVDDRYQPFGLVRTADVAPARHRTSARATVRIERLSGVWLPAFGTPSSVSLDGAVVDPADGTLALPAHVRPGLTYDLQGTVDTPSAAQLSIAPMPGATPARYLALPGRPASFGDYARAAVRGASTPLEEAVALEHAVSTDRSLSPAAPTGSSYGRLTTFLFGPRGTNGAQVGTAEQFAAAFAVLARSVGLPTRLVVGFVVPAAGTDGVSVVRGRDATVWPEIYFDRLGWVPFAPTPGGVTEPDDASLRDTVLRTLADRGQQLQAPPPVTPAAPTSPVSHPAPAQRSSGWAVPAAVAAGAVVLALLLVLLALRWARRWRHGRQGACGAWAEIVDLLVLLGRRPPPERAAPDVAADLDAELGTSGSAAVVAHAADRQAFAPASPDAPEVWRHVRVVRRRARARVPAYRRAVLALDPRPLVRR